jgi:hypothetical protein
VRVVSGGVGNGKVAGAGVSSGLSGVAVVTEVGVGCRMDGRFGGSMGYRSWG